MAKVFGEYCWVYNNQYGVFSNQDSSYHPLRESRDEHSGVLCGVVGGEVEGGLVRVEEQL